MYETYVRGYRRRARERAGRCSARARRARTLAERLAALLAERHGARRVWLYGSTLDPARFHERSDVDLATEGVADWVRAGLDCEAIAGDLEVSLVPIECATRSLRASIDAEGVLLHDASA